MQSLTLLPHLLHTALLALLSASIPLSTILTSSLIAISANSTLTSPTATELLRAKPIRSAHVFAFSADGRMLLNESEGSFSLEEWDEAAEAAEEVCCGEVGGVGLGEGMDVDGKEGANLDAWLREVIAKKVKWETRWKTAK
jgi:exosome complex component RRP46